MVCIILQMNKRKKILPTINLLLFLLFIINFLFIYYSKHNNSYINSIAKLKSEYIYNRLNSYIDPIFKSADYLSKDKSVIQWYENGEDEETLEYLLNEQIDFIGVSAIEVASSISGYVYQIGGTKVKLNETNSRDKWYYKFMAQNKNNSIEPYYDSSTGILYIYYNVKIFNNENAILGMYGYLIKYNSIISVLDEFSDTLEAYLVNNNGEIYLHSDQSKIGDIDIYDYYGLLQARDTSDKHVNIISNNHSRYVFNLPHIESYLIIENRVHFIGNILNSPEIIVLLILGILNILFLILSVIYIPGKK